MASKAAEIASGFGNLLKDKFGLTSEEERRLFNSRLEICNNCEHGQGVRCKLCGCVIVAKTKSVHSECPDKLW